MVGIAVIVWGINLYKILHVVKEKDVISTETADSTAMVQSRADSLPKVSKFNEEGRDPFAPAVKKEIVSRPAANAAQKMPVVEVLKPPPWKIEGILMQDNGSVAILRQMGTDRTEMVRVSDTVGGMTILKIERDKVNVLYKKKPFTIQ
ncbi:MAG: hypothetical protein A2268_02260 [Candidatus Raymondbacteria bacterium RifOxyA12_full_50_37]|uniref:Type II secretion system protein GspC N-terminal domain-containing protein n=1 Tax=Candidatus Raymondbacteria bacterium RIFOXYD12_FULL_49_13 TaxID=1817890 RepID=A0A1F7F5C7_UNCRA|nr:MAG: hypothetical protein A2350_07785 [Candidatus Raymondbacteria bacterium RifOxyB12_full_50_8]OGJ91278.1 MAG: hypothetical protein A2268_02260 [Candidatus Raymondbacteria bacterium RifOxyA12_full_50_37]OGJ92248.1 MAG: hypothetical protein A2248_11090 [Candidatus Raymondbacteria bacterium RIFOXYA2_FULL_49_16]OGJ98574.1 MAG: hypothetical protein A2453_06890 [Candidatus Raymondbacteria bacterium RIFOXYC2_FULL_50_21]OGK01875.1 MAG: hypothetical protein A2519_04785 [Candidatus Raymondbacteria b